MELAVRIDNDLKQAMKQRNASVVETLRMLRAIMKNAQIEKREQLTEQEVLKLIRTHIKQIKDARESFVAGKREDLAQKADAEIAIIEAYLPPQMDESALRKLVEDKVAAIGKDPKNFGTIMKEVIQAADGQAGGKEVQALVKAALE